MLRLIDDVRAGRTAAACAAMDPKDVADQRLSLLGALKLPKGTHAERRAYIEEQRIASEGCAGTVRLMARELADDLPAIRHRAATGPLSHLFPPEADVPEPSPWQLGREEWTILARDGRWIVTGMSSPWSADPDA